MSSSPSRPGRQPDPTTHQRWQQRLESFRLNGLTVVTFCGHEGISTASFYAWRRRLQADPNAIDPDTTHLIPSVPSIRPSAHRSNCSSPPV